MLCPKCGYITFDKIETCPKCRKNCAVVDSELVGTVTNVEPQGFLGSVLKDYKAPETEVAEASSESTPAESPELDLSDEEISLDELPGIDLVDESADVGLSEEFDLSLGNDAEDAELVGDIDEEPASLDLNDIDLSDLVTEEAASEQSGPEISADIDLNETPSASTPEAEGEIELNLADLESSQDQAGSDTIELDLDDDSLDLDLELEPESAEEKKDSPVIPDLGLSLDLDE